MDSKELGEQGLDFRFESVDVGGREDNGVGFEEKEDGNFNLVRAQVLEGEFDFLKSPHEEGEDVISHLRDTADVEEEVCKEGSVQLEFFFFIEALHILKCEVVWEFYTFKDYLNDFLEYLHYILFNSTFFAQISYELIQKLVHIIPSLDKFRVK